LSHNLKIKIYGYHYIDSVCFLSSTANSIIVTVLNELLLSALSRVGPGRSMEKKNGHLTRCRLSSGNRPTLPKCGKKSVVLLGLRSLGLR